MAIAGAEHDVRSGTSLVQVLLEVLAGLLQNRSAFSHAVIPDQLSSKVLS